jgi:hypothetical protein
MPKKTKNPRRSAAPAPVTADRAARLCRLLRLLGRKPQPRKYLVDSLGMGIRGFYRDLEALRAANIALVLKDGRYALSGDLSTAIARLPFPDPGLTLGEARQLCRGRSTAHRKLKKQMERILKG